MIARVSVCQCESTAALPHAHDRSKPMCISYATVELITVVHSELCVRITITYVIRTARQGAEHVPRIWAPDSRPCILCDAVAAQLVVPVSDNSAPNAGATLQDIIALVVKANSCCKAVIVSVATDLWRVGCNCQQLPQRLHQQHGPEHQGLPELGVGGESSSS